nr:MAG TPA: hypothetical protein [Caudoviricetes sp.]
MSFSGEAHSWGETCQRQRPVAGGPCVRQGRK